MSRYNREYLKLAAKEIEAKFPDNHGFILLVVPFEGPQGGRLRYISSIDRQSAINVLKEFLIKSCGQDEDWLQHL